MWIVIAIAVAVLVGLVLSFGVTQRRWLRAKPGDLWLHDPQGNLIEDDPEFKKPRNEGDLL
jgi:hypothetical protein